MIDLRSDTVTKPTAAMRQAMAAAEVGDDVLGDDPTVIALERRTAELLGKEAAVYMPSGTMTNQVAIRTHTEPGDEIILDANAHVYYYEAGAPAGLSGVMCRLIEGERGIFTGEQLRKALRPQNLHHPRTRLVCVENTHNRGGGSIWPMAGIVEVERVAREAGLRLHLDGARLWNASVATGIPEREYASHFDSVSVCFSKGLGAPVGSCLCGTTEFIARARRFRKMFGGGMRQAGIIAAGALYALEHHRERLKEDHANAKALAKGLAGAPGIEVRPEEVETNIVIIRVTKPAATGSSPGALSPAAEFSKKLIAAGVGMLANGFDTVRAVANLEVSAADIAKAIEIVRRVAN
ncbi:MAG: low-specificity L-threonine aldolase [Phycisphaerae bacterium]